jgi:hypothetical protein
VVTRIVQDRVDASRHHPRNRHLRAASYDLQCGAGRLVQRLRGDVEPSERRAFAFHRHRADLAQRDIGVICSFGAGYSIGSVIVRKV